jgi:hypothetical protein
MKTAKTEPRQYRSLIDMGPTEKLEYARDMMRARMHVINRAYELCHLLALQPETMQDIAEAVLREVT